MSLLNPSEYIPGEDEYSYIPNPPSQNFAQQGPGLAASGNIGALQRLNMLDAGTAATLRDRMMSRVRTPEQMDAAVQQRRGALQQLNNEITAPENDRTFFYNMLANSAIARGKGTNWEDSMSLGIGQAMMDKRKQEELGKANRVLAAKNNYDFEGVEDKAADTAENKAMSELTKIAVAQSKPASGAAAKAFAPKRVPGVGLVDLSVTGPDGRPVPKILVREDGAAAMYEKFHKQYQILATSEAFKDRFKTDAEVTEWIHNNAITAMKNAAKQRGAPDSVVEMIPSLLTKPESAPAQPVGVSGDTPSLAAISPDVQVKRDSQAVQMLQEIVNSPKASEEEKAYAAEELRVLQEYRAKNPVKSAVQNVGATPLPQPQAGLTFEKVQQPATGQIQKAGVIAAPGGVPLKTQADRAGEKKSAELSETTSADIMKDWQAKRNIADDTLNTVSNISALRPEFNPGKFSKVKGQLGGYLNAVGIKGGISDEAGRIEVVNKMIQQQVNERMTMEKGVQTEGDTTRFREAYLNSMDTPYAFDLTLGMLKETALRHKMRSDVAERHISTNKSHAGIQQTWDAYKNQELGAMLLRIKDKPMWRHEFIEQAIRDNPNFDPREVEAHAAKSWVELTRQQDGRK